MESGIYQIENQINGKRYVGSAVSLSERWQNHLSALHRCAHHNRYLQRAFDKYGESAFAFTILERVRDSSRLIPREQYYLDTLKPAYNMCRTAGNTLRRRASLEARERMSKAHKGRVFNEEHCRKISEGQRGRQVSEETRGKISRALMGRHPSIEARRKMSESRKGKHQSKEARKKISEAKLGARNPNFGKHLSDETRRKISEALKGRVRSEEHCRRLSEALIGRHPSDETRRKLSLALMGNKNASKRAER